MTVIWHVSSHGWGHAARQRELMLAFREQFHNAEVIVASDVPRWFWRGTGITGIVRGSPSPTVEESGWEIDLAATRKKLMDFLDRLDSLLAEELKFHEDLGVDLVVSDIDPLPVAAASAAGIPAFGIGNFTWDWILAELFPDLKLDIARVSLLYSKGTYLRLPMGPPGHNPFKTTVDVPLLASGHCSDTREVRHLFTNGLLCLVALRELPPGGLPDLPQGFLALSSSPEPLSSGILNITPKELSSRGLVFSDLVAAADVVISKAGYGIISQILALGKPCVLLTGRGFPEERFLLEHMRERNTTVILKPGEERDLSCHVRRAVSEPLPAREAADGAEFILSQGYLDPFDRTAHQATQPRVPRS